MKHIHFIINPVAGSGKMVLATNLIKEAFDPTLYMVTMKYTKYKKHAEMLSKESLASKADIIVACGGDGTINEVASCLLNSSALFGIIPIGSGNGLASHLKISKNITKAIQCIKAESIKTIDVGKIHERYFFSNAGIGFDSQVIHNYESSKNRKLSSYVMATWKSLIAFTKNDELEIEINGKSFLINPFMLFISNSNELGYHISLTPKASLEDGMLDVLLVSNLAKQKAVLFGILMLFKKHTALKEVECFQTSHVTIKRKSENVCRAQIDGEIYDILPKNFSITMFEKSLNVIV